MTDTTPASLRELAARADQLAADITAAGEHLGREGFRLPDAAGQARDAADALRETAEDQARGRARPADACPAEWGVCPDHGNTLTSTGGRTWCRAEHCERTWGYDRVSMACAEPARWLVTDAAGGAFHACDGHAIAAREQLIDAKIEPTEAGA